MVKSEFPLRGDLLTVPTNLEDPRLRNAGHAWLEMVLELAAQEVLCEVALRWYRKMDGSAPVLLLSLDSSKNHVTRNLADLPGAPPNIFKRRERFDAAVAKLMARTTPEDLWAALAGQPLTKISAWDLIRAAEVKSGVGRYGKLTCYPSFTDCREFLFHLLQGVSLPPVHPWL